MSALTYLQQRRRRLILAREELRSIFRAGGMSDAELLDLVSLLIAQCGPEQQEAKEQLLTIAADLDLDAPDADAFRYLGPVTFDSRMEAP
ncbi:hypothetical protein VLK31_34750 [Variovorax sp. H27-G14]|uniref:hypothetical protein n=1 Tax=Variovorax sp. H27-G14 TaxID=3111914 RepID=UPI0038FC887A